MPRQRPAKPKTRTAVRSSDTSALRSIPAAEAFSFLRETRGLSTWTARDMASSLKISVAEAREVISILELQGYIKQSSRDEWMTTIAGESVSGSKTPRYTPERIEKALADLRNRIVGINRDLRAEYEVTKAVAFGDFLQHRTRVQPAEVGIELKRRRPETPDAGSAEEHKGQIEFLKQLKGKGGVLQLKLFEQWMNERTHATLL